MKPNKSKIFNYLAIFYFAILGFIITFPGLQISLNAKLILIIFGMLILYSSSLSFTASLIRLLLDQMVWMDKEYMHGFKLFSQIFEPLEKFAQYTHSHSEGKEKQESNTMIAPDYEKQVSEYQMLKKDFEKIKTEFENFKEIRGEIKAIQFNYKFLLWFVPVAISIIAILITLK